MNGLLILFVLALIPVLVNLAAELEEAHRV